MKHTIAILALAVTFVCGTANAANPYFELGETAATSIVTAETSATSSDQLSTTGTLSPNVSAVHFYITTTIGSATNHIVTPVGAVTNAVSTGYFGCPEYNETMTASGRYHIRVPAEQFPGKYFGILYKETGTATGNAIGISYKLEYYK